MLSKNAAGIVFLFASVIGLDLAESDVAEFISALGTIVSFGLMVWNQVDRSDTKWFFFKK